LIILFLECIIIMRMFLWYITFLMNIFFAVYTKTPWFAYIANYFSTRKLPPQLPVKEKQKVIKTSAPYSRIDGELYKSWPDLIIWRFLRIWSAWNIEIFPWWSMWRTFCWQNNFLQNPPFGILLAIHFQVCQRICKKMW